METRGRSETRSGARSKVEAQKMFRYSIWTRIGSGGADPNTTVGPDRQMTPSCKGIRDCSHSTNARDKYCVGHPQTVIERFTEDLAGD